MYARGPLGRDVVLGLERGGRLHDGSEGDLARVAYLVLDIVGVGFQCVEQRGDALDQGVVDLSLVLEDDDLLLAVLTLLVDLGLFRADEGALVYVGVDFDVGVIAKLESVLVETG